MLIDSVNKLAGGSAWEQKEGSDLPRKSQAPGLSFFNSQPVLVNPRALSLVISNSG